MTILITMKHAQLIKKELGLNLPHIKSSHRAEAMARGLGWKTNAALRAALMCGDTECHVSEDAFTDYLADKGFVVGKGCSFEAIVSAVNKVDATAERPFANVPAMTDQSFSFEKLGQSKWSAVAFGFFAVICYLLLTVQTADKYLDRAMAKSLDVASSAATRSVLILDLDLGQEVAAGLLEYPYITSVEILDDHGKQMVMGKQTVSMEGYTERFQALLTVDDEVVFERILNMPAALSNRPGMLRVTVNKAKALSVLPGPTWGGMIFSLFLGIAVLTVLVFGRSAFRNWMRVYLAQHYHLVHG